MFSATDIFRFQLGHEGAIRRVLESRWSLLVGAIFVVTAGVARHYDQKYLIWEWWVGQPFVIGVVSAFAIFLTAWIALRMGRAKREDRPSFPNQFLSFLGAFLMTAPLAWLYAIPLEQWISLEAAARCNIALLAVVAFWRVALMVRVLILVTGANWFRCLLVVLLPSSVEALVMGVGMHMHLVGLMGGIQYPTHEQIMMDALDVVTTVSFFTAVATFSLLVGLAFKKSELCKSFPAGRPGVPKQALVVSLIALVAWTFYSLPWQMKQYRRFVVRSHFHAEDYRRALDYLAAHERSDFPLPSHLPPDPYDLYRFSDPLVGVLEVLHESDPEWLIQEYSLLTRIATKSRLGGRYVGEAVTALEALTATAAGRKVVLAEEQAWLQLLDLLGPNERGWWDDEYYGKFAASLEKAGVELPPPPPPKPEFDANRVPEPGPTTNSP